MAITSVNVPLNSSVHVTAIDLDTLASLPPSAVTWADGSGNNLLSSHALTITPDATGFFFAAGNTIAAGNVVGTYQGGNRPQANLAVSTGPNTTHLGFTSP